MDSKAISAFLKELDVDVATRFVLSALGANKAKIKEAFQIAVEEMTLRKKKKKPETKTPHEMQKKIDEELRANIAKVEAENAQKAQKAVDTAVKAIMKKKEVASEKSEEEKPIVTRKRKPKKPSNEE